MPTARCALGCPPRTFPTHDAALGWLNAHHDRDHLGRQTEVKQLDTVTWHEQALQAVLTLARSGRPFVISEVIELGVPDAANPRTDWPRIQGEAQRLGWIEPTGRLGHSVRPTTKGSPVTEWRGTAKAAGAAA